MVLHRKQLGPFYVFHPCPPHSPPLTSVKALQIFFFSRLRIKNTQNHKEKYSNRNGNREERNKKNKKNHRLIINCGKVSAGTKHNVEFEQGGKLLLKAV